MYRFQWFPHHERLTLSNWKCEASHKMQLSVSIGSPLSIYLYKLFYLLMYTVYCAMCVYVCWQLAENEVKMKNDSNGCNLSNAVADDVWNLNRIFRFWANEIKWFGTWNSVRNESEVKLLWLEVRPKKKSYEFGLRSWNHFTQNAH